MTCVIQIQLQKIHNDLDVIEDSKIAHHDLAIALSVLPTLEDLNKKLSIFDFNLTLGDLEEKFRNIRKSNMQLVIVNFLEKKK